LKASAPEVAFFLGARAACPYFLSLKFHMQKKVTIYGAGYVGLVTGVCLAELGHTVLLIDTNQKKIAALQRGICPIYEPSLPQLLERHIQNGRLSFGTDVTEGVQHGLFQFIAVGTPSAEDGSADLQYVFHIARDIAAVLPDYRLIVTKSTVPVGTSSRIQTTITDILEKRGVQIPFDMVSNPEFLKQGGAIADFMHPERIIMGAENAHAYTQMCALYADLNDNGQRFILMDLRSAELTKYVANAYLATRVSFMNEMSQLAESLGADINMVRRGIGSDSRIGPHFLMAGCGFGGSCFPKDVRALIQMAESTHTHLHLLHATERVNHQQKQILFKKIMHHFSGDIAGKTIALWGLAFKPNTDDMREAPSCTLIEALLAAGAQIRAYDPAANTHAQRLYAAHLDRIHFCEKADAVLEKADVLVIVTEWDEFKHPDFSHIQKTLAHPVIFDGRNIYDPSVVAAHGLTYYAIGHGENGRLAGVSTERVTAP
jgi:UDPglucose 6-dehydrogenase